MSTQTKARLAEAAGPSDRVNPIQVIARAAAVLRALEDEETGLSLGQIANRVQLPRSTVQRITSALEAEQFIMIGSTAGSIKLGPALLRLAASVNTNGAEVIKPLIIELSAVLKETVDISVPKRDHLLFVDQVIGPQRLRTVSAVGEPFPLFCTANGKAFLATLSDEEIIRRIGRTYEARTQNTATSFAALKADLKKTIARGYALDAEEHALGITAIGVLIHDLLGNPLMVSIPVPTARFEQHRGEIVDQLMKTKSELQKLLGERP